MTDDNDLPETKQRFFAYRLTGGQIHVRRFNNPSALEDAYDSPFVDEVLDPYEAENRAEAEKIAVERLMTKREV